MIMTSVSGHLMGNEFTAAYKGWTQCRPVQLFDAPVVYQVPEVSAHGFSSLLRIIS